MASSRAARAAPAPPVRRVPPVPHSALLELQVRMEAAVRPELLAQAVLMEAAELPGTTELPVLAAQVERAVKTVHQVHQPQAVPTEAAAQAARRARPE